MSETEKGSLLCRVDFPLYGAAMISPRHILVAGGGGSANTGVKNGFQIFEITTDGENCIGTSVCRFYTGEFSVMSLSARGNINNNQPLKVYVAAGHNEYCQVYSITLGRERHLSESGLRQRNVTNGTPGQKIVNDDQSKLVFQVEPLKKVQIDFHEK
ncbi:prolactin regulatory element-binding protein, partial [Eurytemora carolleeae]|uniref:prolactin regulatory element-binding protein n=1 Tax=Eurytemora carolleeae TaxID=1294199 RepID=UPI000C793D51